MESCPIDFNCADMGLTDEGCLNRLTCIVHAAYTNLYIPADDWDDWEEELAVCERDIELRPNDFRAWEKLGNVLEKLGRDEEALAACERAIEIRSYEYFAWGLQSRVLEKLGRDKEARAACEESISCIKFWRSRLINSSVQT